MKNNQINCAIEDAQKEFDRTGEIANSAGDLLSAVEELRNQRDELKTDVEPIMRTPEEIIVQTNNLAAMFYKCWGYDSPKDFRFDLSNHGHEQIAWQQSCIAQLELTQTDVDDVFSEIED